MGRNLLPSRVPSVIVAVVQVLSAAPILTSAMPFLELAMALVVSAASSARHRQCAKFAHSPPTGRQRAASQPPETSESCSPPVVVRAHTMRSMDPGAIEGLSKRLAGRRGSVHCGYEDTKQPPSRAPLTPTICPAPGSARLHLRWPGPCGTAYPRRTACRSAAAQAACPGSTVRPAPRYRANPPC